MTNRKRLVLLIFFVLSTGFLITSLTSYFVSRTSLRSEITLNQLPLTSDNVYSEIQRDLLRPIFISSIMATDTFLRDWVINGEHDAGKITRYLKEIKKKFNTFTSFFVSDKTGMYYHADGILKKVSRKEKRDAWYFRVREMDKDYEINVDVDMANDDTITIFINYKVYDYNKNFIGSTGVGLKVDAVKNLIEKYQKKYVRNIYLIDKKGNIKLHSSTFPKTVKNIYEIMGLSEIADEILSGNKTSSQYENNARTVYLHTRYIPQFDWYLFVEQSEEKSIRSIFNALLINLIICIIIIIVVLFLIKLILTAYQKRIDTLRGIVPICSFCKKIRDDKGYWNQVEAYVEKYTDAEFSHGYCPECIEKHYPEYSKKNDL